MTRIVKFVAVVVSITTLVMPAAAVPFHCILTAPAGENLHACRMMGVNSSADQIKATPFQRPCCEVSAARPESLIVPGAPAGSGLVAPPTSPAFFSDLPAAPVVHEPFDWKVQSPGGPPQALLCTFLI